MNQAPSPSRTKRVLMTGGVLLLFAGMIALGLLSNRPAPPRSTDDPQPLLQLYRQHRPAALLDSLPLFATDEFRLLGDQPPDMKSAFFCITQSGGVECYPAHFQERVGITGLMRDYVGFPAEANGLAPIGTPKGTRIYLLCANQNLAPTLEAIKECVGSDALPALTPHVTMRFTRSKLGPICSRGARLPNAGELKAIDDRLSAFCASLSKRVDFFAGIAVCVE